MPFRQTELKERLALRHWPFLYLAFFLVDYYNLQLSTVHLEGWCFGDGLQ